MSNTHLRWFMFATGAFMLGITLGNSFTIETPQFGLWYGGGLIVVVILWWLFEAVYNAGRKRGQK